MTWLELKTVIDEQLKKQGVDPNGEDVTINYFDFSSYNFAVTGIDICFDEDGLTVG